MKRLKVEFVQVGNGYILEVITPYGERFKKEVSDRYVFLTWEALCEFLKINESLFETEPIPPKPVYVEGKAPKVPGL